MPSYLALILLMSLFRRSASLSKTIYALSTAAPGPLAVVRVSGSDSWRIAQEMCNCELSHRIMKRADIRTPKDRDVIDNGMVVAFKSPKSYTGEDVVEFHVHGSLPVIDLLLLTLGQFSSCRMAEKGEFTRRAFENNKLTLPEVESLASLISSKTESQRKMSLQTMAYSKNYQIWRGDIIKARANLEAMIDFSADDDNAGEMWGRSERRVCRRRAGERERERERENRTAKTSRRIEKGANQDGNKFTVF